MLGILKSFFQDVMLVTFASAGAGSVGVLLIAVLESRLMKEGDRRMVDEFWWYTATLYGFLAGGFWGLSYWISHL